MSNSAKEIMQKRDTYLQREQLWIVCYFSAYEIHFVNKPFIYKKKKTDSQTSDNEESRYKS